MSLLSLNNVTIKYGAEVAVENASLDIFAQDFIGVIGPNGGGKTSLVKAILGLVPYEGTMKFSEELTKPGSIGYLPQKNNFDTSFPITVLEVVLSGLQAKNRFLKKVKNQDRNRALELLEKTGIPALAKRPIGELSGGQLQRTLLCRALISDPKLLILDEPANSVDNKFENELYEILKSLNDHMTIIMVSHDLGTITSFVKSVVCVNKTVHRHNTNELTNEMLENYRCPIQVIQHGEVPHTVLKKH